MAKHVVTEFGIEVQFSDKVMAGLNKLEGNVMKAATTMERALNRAFKTNGAKLMEQTLGKVVRDTNNASRQMKKALTDAFDIKNAGRQSIRGFESDAKSAAKRVSKQFRDSMRFTPPTGAPYGRQRRGQPPTPSGGGRGGSGRGGLSFTERQDRWMASHNVRTTENGMTNTMSRLGMTSQLGAFRASMGQVLERHKGSGNTQEYEREARQIINGYKDIIRNHKDYNRALEKSKFMQHGFNDSLRNMAVGMASAYTLISGFKKAIQAGRERQSANMASDAVFSENAPNNKNAALESRVWAAGFARQIGQSYTDTVKQLTSFTASAAPSMGIAGSQNFYQQATTYGRMHGLNQYKLSHTMLAFEQMASKGQVYAEELKGQLAEALPGSEQLFAKALYGSSSKENVAKLINDMKAGLLKADVVLPKVAAEMQRQNDAAGGLAKISKMTAVALDNVTSEMDGMFASIYKGMDEGLGTLARALANMFFANAGSAEDFGAMLGWVFEQLAPLADVIATVGMNFHGLVTMLKIQFDELDPVTQRFLTNIGGVVGEIAGAGLRIGAIYAALKLARSGAGIIGGLIGFGGAGAAAGAGAAGAAGAGGAGALGAGAGAAGAVAGVSAFAVVAVAAAAYMLVKPLADSIFDSAINAHGQKTLAGGNIIADSPVGEIWQGGINAWHSAVSSLNDAIHSPLINQDSKLGSSFFGQAANQQIVIPANAFQNVQMPLLRGKIVVDIPQADGSFKTQTVELLGDQLDSTYSNAGVMGGGWQPPQYNVGWQRTTGGQ